MLSYSVNRTFRVDEIFWASDFGASGPYAHDVNYNHGAAAGSAYTNYGAGAGVATGGGGVRYYAPDLYYDNRSPYGSPAFGSGEPPKYIL